MPPSRIEKLTVRHFKSINGTLEISLNKKNLVVLGENGSGKTTLTRALAAVLDASRRDTDEARKLLFEPCIDADPDSKPGLIRLELEGGSAFTLHQDGRWNVSGNRAAMPVSLAEAAKAKRVLVLDDVLIGLDMDNRKPTLGLLDRHFTGWQTVMLTYDPQWFETVREWSESRDWLCLKLHRANDFANGTTLLDKGEGMLGDARRLSRSGDLSAAANAARSAFESVLKRYFEKNDVPMPHTTPLAPWQAIPGRLNALNFSRYSGWNERTLRRWQEV